MSEKPTDEIFFDVAQELDAAVISVRCLLLHLEEAMRHLENIREVKEYTAEAQARMDAIFRGEAHWEE
ncbi:MAG: hypothetical protein ACP5FL_06245 [Thermoplasmatota archaeon]